MICAKEAWENKQTIMIGDEEMEKKAEGFSTGRYQPVVDERQKNQIEKRKRNLKTISPILRGEREI